MYRQLILFGLLVVSGCSPSGSSSIDAVEEWTFALSNPMVKLFPQAPLLVGDRFEVAGDSLRVTNDITLLEKTLPLFTAETLPGRVVMLRKWKLSKDRSYLNLYDGSFYGQAYLPILSWEDDAVTFRMPLKVKTREPRGLELESYANLDAFVRIEAIVPATSSK